MLANGDGGDHKLASLLGMYIVLGSMFIPTATRYRYRYVSVFFTVALCVICDNFHSLTVQNVLLLLMLALQPTMGFSLLGDFLPFRPFLTQFSPPSYSHHLDVFLNIFNASFPWSSSDSPPHWLFQSNT